MSAPTYIVRRAARGQRGITILELLLVVIIGLVLVAVTMVSIQRWRRTDVRSAARLMAGTLRYAHDRSRVTGRDHRMVFELSASGGTSVKLEIARKGKQLLPRTMEEAFAQHDSLNTGQEIDELTQLLSATTRGGLSKALASLPTKRANSRAQWSKARLRTSASRDGFKRAGKLVKSIFVPRLNREFEEGKVALHMWSGGWLEPAAIYLDDGRGRQYTLITYPLTGRVTIHEGRVEFPSNRVGHDDLGDEVKER